VTPGINLPIISPLFNKTNQFYVDIVIERGNRPDCQAGGIIYIYVEEH